MKNYSLEQFREKLNEYGRTKTPCYFLSDFKLDNNHVLTEEELEKSPLKFSFQEKSNLSHPPAKLSFKPISRVTYQQKFDRVMNQIIAGNTFLINLTQATPVSIDQSLGEIFRKANSPFKLYWKDKFVVFSPEAFIKVKSGKVSSFPMKGTISADIPDAAKKLLADRKETAEHATIVDLIRNDMSIYATDVRVSRYKYLEKIKTRGTDILQMSSEISGQWKDFPERMGDYLTSMLPAGSVSGAPKPKTVDIINEVEGYDRGYYCGVAGYFDGNSNLESFVLIRYLESKEDGSYHFKSGGGITHLSNEEEEYKELVNKIYVPFY